MIKVFGEDVLIHETLTKKVSKIYLSENDFKDNKNTFFITEAKILDVGQDATEVPIGTQALFKDFASPSYVEDISGDNNSQVIERFSIYSKGMLAGCKFIEKQEG